MRPIFLKHGFFVSYLSLCFYFSTHLLSLRLLKFHPFYDMGVINAFYIDVSPIFFSFLFFGGFISQIVENPVIDVQLTDGAAQSAIQYFENMRNFLVAVGEMKLLTFEASDLEKVCHVLCMLPWTSKIPREPILENSSTWLFKCTLIHASERFAVTPTPCQCIYHWKTPPRNWHICEHHCNWKDVCCWIQNT